MDGIDLRVLARRWTAASEESVRWAWRVQEAVAPSWDSPAAAAYHRELAERVEGLHHLARLQAEVAPCLERAAALIETTRANE